MFIDIKETDELNRLKEIADKKQQEYRDAESNHINLQSKVRKEVLEEFDIEFNKLKEQMLEMKRKRRNITKTEYNKNAKLRWLKKKKNDLWKENVKSWESFHKEYEKEINKLKNKNGGENGEI